MKKFDVHVYIPVRFKVAGIEAADHKEAAAKAEDMLTNVDLTKFISSAAQKIGIIDDASKAEVVDVSYEGDQAVYCLVDPLLEDGEIDYDNAKWIEKEVAQSTTPPFRAELARAGSAAREASND